jgi:hypothetical protein
MSALDAAGFGVESNRGLALARPVGLDGLARGAGFAFLPACIRETWA